MKKDLYSIIILIASVIFVAFVSTGCKTQPLPKCIDEKNKDISLRWGEYFTQTKSLKGYHIAGTGKFYSFTEDSTGKIDQKDLGFIDGDWFCMMTKRVQQAILKVQVSNEPADTTEFLEFAVPASGIYYRGKWVRRFKTRNSMLFRDIYDTLQAYKLYKEK